MSDRTIVVTGGLDKSPIDSTVDNYLLSLCAVSKPRVCFLPTASGDSWQVQQTFRERFERLPCDPSVLRLFERDVRDIEAHLLEQHLIVVGDGSPVNLCAVWAAHGVDRAMLRAWERGVVLAGFGAGALCWFESGITHSFGPELSVFKQGLSLIKGSFCAHYDSDGLRRSAFRSHIERGDLPAGFAIDDGVLLRFKGDELDEVVGVLPGNAYRLERTPAGLAAKKLPARLLETVTLPAARTRSEQPASRHTSPAGPSRAKPQEATVIYTDGACSGNPGPGGWAWAVAGGTFASGADRHTTNQRMEVTAAYQAVLANSGPLEVVSDSTYVVNCFKQRWWEGWLKRGWINSQRRPVANRDLWEPFIELVRARNDVTFRWVKGHSEDRMNQFVDQLAVEASVAQRGRTGKSPPGLG
jgi:ribonuclease HI